MAISAVPPSGLEDIQLTDHGNGGLLLLLLDQ